MAKSPAWLTPALDYIPQWLGYQMRQSEQPGCSIAIAHQGKIVLEQAYGFADVSAGQKLTPRHRFRVASHSKSFTAAAIMKLREQGRLKLDDTAGQYVEGLHPDIATATIAQLLSHTAGIFRDGTESPYWAVRAPFSNTARIRADLTLPPAIAANTRLKYSNHGFALAGLVIEAITAEPYNVWVKREIVDAAGLTETTPDVPLPSGTKLARGHGSKILLGSRIVLPGDQSTFALAAATGFVSTAADLARFYAQLSPAATRSFLSVESRREMTRPQWHDAFALDPRGYGLGIITGKLDGQDWFGHSGGFPGYITRSASVPALDLSLSVLTNAADGMSHQFLDGALHILNRFRQAGPPAKPVADWTGRWWSLWGASDLVPMGDKVLLALPGNIKPFEKVPELSIIDPDTATITQSGAFGSFGEPVRRLRNKAGKISELRIASGRSVPEAQMIKELRAHQA